MRYYLIKLVLSAAVIVAVSEVSKSLSEKLGARLCRPRPAAAHPRISTHQSLLTRLRLVFDPAALLFQTGSKRSSLAGGLLASLPLTSLLAMVWLGIKL